MFSWLYNSLVPSQYVDNNVQGCYKNTGGKHGHLLPLVLFASEVLALTQIDFLCAWKEIRLGFSGLFVLYHTYFPHPLPHSLLYMLTPRCTCILVVSENFTQLRRMWPMSGMKCLYFQHHKSFPPILPSQVGVSGKGAKAPITQHLGHWNSISESSAMKSWGAPCCHKLFAACPI